MYLRFVIYDKDSDSHRRQGLLVAGSEFVHSGKFNETEAAQFKALGLWFSTNLKVPHRFTRSKNPNAHQNAISWFKDGAKEHIEKMREIAQLLENHGVRTKMIK